MLDYFFFKSPQSILKINIFFETPAITFLIEVQHLKTLFKILRKNIKKLKRYDFFNEKVTFHFRLSFMDFFTILKLLIQQKINASTYFKVQRVSLIFFYSIKLKAHLNVLGSC